MKRNSFADRECPIARAVEQIGEAWNLLILRELLLGTRSFGDLERRLTIPPSTLTRRLSALEADGLVERRAIDARPPRDEYRPTGKAKELFPLFVALSDWSNRWLVGNGQEHLVFVDVDSGHRVRPELVDRRSDRPVSLSSVRLAAGPEASAELRRGLARRRSTEAAPLRARIATTSK